MNKIEAWLTFSMSFPPYYKIWVEDPGEHGSLDYNKIAIDRWIRNITLNKSINEINDMVTVVHITYDNPYTNSDPTWKSYKYKLRADVGSIEHIYMVSTARYELPVKDDEC